jgi:phasin family protein
MAILAKSKSSVIKVHLERGTPEQQCSVISLLCFSRRSSHVPKRRTTNMKSRTVNTNKTRSTVRAAAAHTSERISGEAQDTLRSGLKAASEESRRATDQVTQLFTQSAARGEELTRRSAQGLEVLTQTSTALTRGFQNLSREWLTLAQARLQRNVDAMSAIAGCRSLPELFTIQTELVRDNLQHTLEATQRMVELSRRIASEAGQSVTEQAADNAQRIAA